MKSIKEELMDKNREKEANQFARALLMPIPFVKEEVSKLSKDDKTPLKTLSKIFKVEETIMAFRLAELGYECGISS